MKTVLIFLLCSSAFLCIMGLPVSSDMEYCSVYAEHRNCNKIYSPVCGTNRITYPNKCIFCLESRMKNYRIRLDHEGRC
ncbi:serine protease inhibitor Kazal-type 1 [Xenopus laevis]|uniref:Kazal-like domain-containing protein n=2 Tax=Xenopus laevis TaxID=8355 RepID=A0A974HSH1_XENLA|nr:serine protease inhibitor Kazal-type 1 [Xenopus laevis]OCT88639.1 hypothetical protein XELAEV_18017269mg [Xenopus laevis]